MIHNYTKCCLIQRENRTFDIFYLNYYGFFKDDFNYSASILSV